MARAIPQTTIRVDPTIHSGVCETMPWIGSAPNQSVQRTDGSRTGSDLWQQAKALAIKIVAGGHDTHDQDIATMINSTLKKDGGNTATADIPMGGFSLTGLGAAGARTESTNFSDLQDNKGEHIASVSGTDTIVLTPTIALTAYAAGQRYTFTAAGSNTGAVTVNISALGAKSLVQNDTAHTALASGDIVSGQTVDMRYDGTRFKLLSGQITSTLLPADGVTFAKMQNIATDSLIGRDTAGTGDPENITLNATLSMTGAGALQRAALTGDVTAAAGSNTTAIASNAVTYAQMQDIAT